MLIQKVAQVLMMSNIFVYGKILGDPMKWFDWVIDFQWYKNGEMQDPMLIGGRQ